MMIPEGAVVAILAGLLGIAGTLVAARQARSAQREMYPSQIIAALQTQVAALTEQMGTARTEVAEVTRRALLLEDYAHELRDHIADRREPPPPPWPPGLTS